MPLRSGVKVPLFEMSRENLAECKPVTFAHLEIKERADLQHVLRDHIDAISKHLPPSRLRVIPAHLEDPMAIDEALRAQGVNEPERYFLDTPFTQDGKTYVLSKMWGRGTVPALSTLRDAFAEAGVSFQAEE